MKSLSRILLAIFVFTFVMSCEEIETTPTDNTVVETTPEEDQTGEGEVEEDKTEETPGEDQTAMAIDEELISKKWIIEEGGEYISIEFNESGNYIVVKAATATQEEVVLFGTYKIVDNKIIILSDFGTITATKLEQGSISFSITLDTQPNNEVTVNGTEKEEIVSSTRTEMLCRSWKLAKINGESVEGTENELTVLFSAAGTYFVEYSNPEDENDGGLAQWSWQDEEQVKICYSWDGTPVCNGDNQVEIIELNENELQLLEVFNENERELYVLHPVENNSNNSSSARKTKIVSSREIKRGLLKK